MTHCPTVRRGLHWPARMTLFFAATAVGIVAAASPVAADTPLKTANVMTLANGLAFYALLLSMAGICISSAMWAMGSRGCNPGQELTGKRGIILCCTAAFFVGAAPAMINWLEGATTNADSTGVSVTSNATPLSYRDMSSDTGCPVPAAADGTQAVCTPGR